MKKIKAIIASLAAISMIASMNLTVSADENQIINGPNDSLGSISDIAGAIVSAPVTTPAADVPEVTAVSADSTAVTTFVSADSTAVTTSVSADSTAVTTSVSADNTAVTTSVSADSTAVTTSVSLTSEPVVTTTKAAVSYVNDIVIGLDISGSMEDEPIEAMKDAAIEFVSYTLQNDPEARIAIVPFETKAQLGVPLTNDADLLTSYISNLTDKGTTNFTNAFELIRLELENGSGTRKSVVFMADGLPNEGYKDSSSELLQKNPNFDRWDMGAIIYDNENLKPYADVYTVGFFHSLNGKDKANAVDVMRELASDPDHYYDADISNLKEVFSVISDEIVTEATTTQSVPETITEAASTSSNNTNTKTSSSPKTSDKSVIPAAALAAAACITIVVSKKNKKA